MEISQPSGRMRDRRIMFWSAWLMFIVGVIMLLNADSAFAQKPAQDSQNLLGGGTHGSSISRRRFSSDEGIASSQTSQRAVAAQCSETQQQQTDGVGGGGGGVGVGGGGGGSLGRVRMGGDLSGGTWDVAKKETSVITIIFSLYTVVFFLGLPGNILVVHVVLRNRAMQSITNLFITNLAISDILMTLVATPFTPVALYMNSWTLPAALCKLLPTTMCVSVYVSTLTSTAIAVDRFFVIVHPFVPRMKKWLCALIIVTVWSIAILISMPLAVYQQKNLDPCKNVTSCQETWPKESAREVFTIVSFVLQFVVPCSIISVCYLKVSLILRVRCRTKIGTGTKSRYKEEHEIRRKRRTNTMLIAMVVIFVICWIPLNVLWIVIDVISDSRATSMKRNKYFTLIFFVCHLLAMSSAVYNPFLYAWMNENFKKEFRRILPCLFAAPRAAANRNMSITMALEWSTITPGAVVDRQAAARTPSPPIGSMRLRLDVPATGEDAATSDSLLLPTSSTAAPKSTNQTEDRLSLSVLARKAADAESLARPRRAEADV